MMKHQILCFVLLPLAANHASFYEVYFSNYICNFEWEKPTAHGTCSYIDSSEYALGPIIRCLFIDYIITQLISSRKRKSGTAMCIHDLQLDASGIY